MSNRFSTIAIPAAIAATMALSLGAALAQSQPTGNPPTQAQPGQPSGTATDQKTGTNSMPMQGMEHGRMMRDQGQKMMHDDQSQQTGSQPSTTQAQPAQPSGAGTDQQTTGTTSTPAQGMEHGRMMRDQGQKMMQNEKTMEHGQMGNPPCGPGQTQTQTTQNSGCK